jgi:arabinose-5-phosphate isomerase
MIPEKEKFCQIGRSVIEIEQQAVADLKDRIGTDFARACEFLLNCKGRLVIMGMGKSGHIGSKLAATFASTGTPSFFLHPAEANHGDLGCIVSNDVVLALSSSGNNPEILAVLPVIKYLGVKLITLTGNPRSGLAKAADVNLDVSVAKEACSFGLAPTSSTTAALVMGDALAVALLEVRGFTAQDFAKNHPGGIIGKKLILKVDSLMHKGSDLPKVSPETTVIDALVTISQKRLGMTTVVGEDGKLIGVYTDGDLRRTLDKGINVHKMKIKDVMSTKCKTIAPSTLAMEALQIMEEYRITSLVVTEQGRPVGVVHIHDLLREGI